MDWDWALDRWRSAALIDVEAEAAIREWEQQRESRAAELRRYAVDAGAYLGTAVATFGMWLLIALMESGTGAFAMSLVVAGLVAMASQSTVWFESRSVPDAFGAASIALISIGLGYLLADLSAGADPWFAWIVISGVAAGLGFTLYRRSEWELGITLSLATAALPLIPLSLGFVVPELDCGDLFDGQRAVAPWAQWTTIALVTGVGVGILAGVQLFARRLRASTRVWLRLGASLGVAIGLTVVALVLVPPEIDWVAFAVGLVITARAWSAGQAELLPGSALLVVGPAVGLPDLDHALRLALTVSFLGTTLVVALGLCAPRWRDKLSNSWLLPLWELLLVFSGVGAGVGLTLYQAELSALGMVWGLTLLAAGLVYERPLSAAFGALGFYAALLTLASTQLDSVTGAAAATVSVGLLILALSGYFRRPRLVRWARRIRASGGAGRLDAALGRWREAELIGADVETAIREWNAAHPGVDRLALLRVTDIGAYLGASVVVVGMALFASSVDSGWTAAGLAWAVSATAIVVAPLAVRHGYRALGDAGSAAAVVLISIGLVYLLEQIGSDREVWLGWLIVCLVACAAGLALHRWTASGLSLMPAAAGLALVPLSIVFGQIPPEQIVSDSANTPFGEPPPLDAWRQWSALGLAAGVSVALIAGASWARRWWRPPADPADAALPAPSAGSLVRLSAALGAAVVALVVGVGSPDLLVGWAMLLAGGALTLWMFRSGHGEFLPATALLLLGGLAEGADVDESLWLGLAGAFLAVNLATTTIIRRPPSVARLHGLKRVTDQPLRPIWEAALLVGGICSAVVLTIHDVHYGLLTLPWSLAVVWSGRSVRRRLPVGLGGVACYAVPLIIVVQNVEGVGAGAAWTVLYGLLILALRFGSGMRDAS